MTCEPPPRWAGPGSPTAPRPPLGTAEKQQCKPLAIADVGPIPGRHRIVLAVDDKGLGGAPTKATRRASMNVNSRRACWRAKPLARLRPIVRRVDDPRS